jgi:hypothetical protein
MSESLPCTKALLLRRLDVENDESPASTHNLKSHEIGGIFWCENKTESDGGLACNALLRMGENRAYLPEVQTPSGKCLAEVAEITEPKDTGKMCVEAIKIVVMLSREGFKSVKKRN